MAKNFSKGFDNLLSGGESKETPVKKQKASQQDNEKDVVERQITFIIKESTHEKLKAVAYWDRKKIKEVVNQMLEEAIKKYEKDNGEIAEIPK